MLNVIDCVLTQHDLRLVAAAALICILSALTAFRLFALARRARHQTRGLWLALTALVAGGGVWTMHFMSMLAYDPGARMQYAIGQTMVSLVLAIAIVGAGFWLAAGKGRAWLYGGAVAGLGIAIMHYVGIGAVRAAFAEHWNAGYVVASIVPAAAGSTLAFAMAARAKGPAQWAGPAVLMTLGIVALHFTAMYALVLTPDLTRQSAPAGMIQSDSLGYLLGAAALMILFAAAGVIVIEAQSRRMSVRSIQASFEDAPLALALFDADLRLLTWNKLYGALALRYGFLPVYGARLGDLVRQAATSGVFPDAVGREEAWANEFWHDRLAGPSADWLFPDGRWLRMESCAIGGGGFTSIINDVTDQVTAATAVIEARDRAEAANQAKSDFLANMSHEIRTPLNGVLGMAQVIEADDLTDLQRDRMKVLRESGLTLLAILNDVLDLSKAQAGKLELSLADVDVGELVRTCCATFEGSAAAKDIVLVSDIAAEAEGYWRADALRLRQVLSNLISNSLKFTLEGAITVGLRRDGEDLILSVTDTGIGMETDQIPRLFEKFTQADASTTRRYGGTGLGLSICRELVELMGGAIMVTSRLGAGSCFTIRLPLTAALVVQPKALAAPETASFNRPTRILAAEDNAINQLVLRSLLAPIDVELTVVGNGMLAVEAAQKSQFDLILMDIQMPVMNGVEATTYIRTWERATGRSPTPILALSANVMTHQVADYLAAGMNGCVAKPVEVSKLYGAINSALEASAPANLEAAA